MSLSLREAALAAVASRLTTAIPSATVERARRAPVEIDTESMPRLVVTGGDLTADETAEPGRTHYDLAFTVTGYVTAANDLAAEQALSSLHAQVVGALSGWTPTAAGIGDMRELGAEFGLYGIDDCAKPAGEFTARFGILAVAPLGGPYSI